MRKKLNKSQRMQLKALACVLGGLLLLLLLLGRLLTLFHREDGPPVPQPADLPDIRTLENVWVTEVEEGEILIFENGTEKRYPIAEGVTVPVEAREQMADILLYDEAVAQIHSKTQKINAKVLAQDGESVTLEGIGRLEFAPGMRGYRLYGALASCGPSDLRIGYDFADFVLEDGKVCGILLVKEEAMQEIRVLIKAGNYSGTFHDVVELTGDTDYIVRYGEGETPTEELHSAGEVLSIGPDSAYFQGERVTVEPVVLTGRLSLLRVERSQGAPSCCGKLELLLTEDGIVVINELPLEEYLYSVVPSEMPASYPAEALKVQAICARTYAYNNMLQAGYPEYGAHVDDSTGYQVYNNILERETATTAVRETYGQLLYTPEGELAMAYYYSTSCGIGSDAGVWGGETAGLEYLSPKPISRPVMEAVQNETLGGQGDLQETDGGAPGSSEIDSGEAGGSETGSSEPGSKAAAASGDYRAAAAALKEETAFREFLQNGSEEDYEASEPWYRWGYEVAKLDCGTVFSRLQARYEANSGRVLAQNEKGGFESAPIEKFSEITDLYIADRGPGGIADELMVVTDKQTLKVLTEHNIRAILNDGKAKVRRQDGSEVSSPNLLPSAFLYLEADRKDGAVCGYRLTGGGFGHGVGMSQNAARNMAAEGRSAEEILRFFYEGCSLRKIYE